MQHPLAALTDIVPSRHPTYPDWAARGPGVRRTAAFLGFLIALAAMIALSASPARGGESIWTHNGSTVRWVSSGVNRWLYYLQPRPGLAAIDQAESRERGPDERARHFRAAPRLLHCNGHAGSSDY
jgi:hypothetical protein